VKGFPMSKKHTISVLVHNQFGVLARVSGMFSARGYNIISLCVGETEDPRFSRMTVTVRGDDNVLAQIIQASSKKRNEVLEIAQIFRARVVDLDPHTMTVEVTGAGGKVAAFIEMMRPFGIRELVRTGVVAIRRSAADHHEVEEENE
jgi:acetolactate synthase-1/3 small subunit